MSPPNCTPAVDGMLEIWDTVTSACEIYSCYDDRCFVRSALWTDAVGGLSELLPRLAAVLLLMWRGGVIDFCLGSPPCASALTTERSRIGLHSCCAVIATSQPFVGRLGWRAVTPRD